MPCRDIYDGDNNSGLIRELGERNDKLARMLCLILGALKDEKAIKELLARNPELKKWWEKHQREDRRRIKAEKIQKRKDRIRKEALSKLTPEERQILGV